MARLGQLTAWLGIGALMLCVPSVFCFSVVTQKVVTCEANGSVYHVGERYSPEPCSHCECTEEGPVCALTMCTALPAACIQVSHSPTDCCPRCEKVGCEYQGKVYEPGKDFQPSACEHCSCNIDGTSIACALADCPILPCVNPVFQDGICCPDCKDGPNCYADDSRTKIIPRGEAVWVDSCTKCRCLDWNDPGYWGSNNVATCTRLHNCTVSEGVNKNSHTLQ